MRFINRDKELALLEKEYKRKDSSFTVIYGRRRVGKTTLIKEFIKNKTALYFLADKQTENLQIHRFKTMYAEQLQDNALKSLEANSWDHLFNYISNHLPPKKKFVIVIDEFQYLVKVNRAIPSIFQRIWDDMLKSRDIMLILCGSLVSMMYSATLSYTSPLYGRRTSQLKLSPLKFNYFKDFFKEKSTIPLIERYSILSGVPKYIELFEDHADIFKAIEENILDKDSFLYQEPVFILNEELGETTTYFSLLEVISRGEHKIGNIAGRLQIPTSNLTSFLDRLIELELIHRDVPVTEKNPSKSKKGLYFIKDHFFRFWFRYVQPYKSYIEMENKKFVLDKIKESFHLFVSQAFEKICMEYLLEHSPLEMQKIGRWWNNREEIDIVAISEEVILVGECKWWDEQVGVNVLQDLQRKAAFLDNEGKKLHFALFAKNGFTTELEQQAIGEKNIFLYDFSKIS